MTDVVPVNSKVPVDWCVKRIDEVARITTGSRNTQDRVADGLFPFFVRSQDVERINSWSYDGEAVLTAGDGVGTGKVFHYINGKFDCHQRVYRIAEFDPAIDGFFFFKQFSQNFYDRIMSMTAKSSVDSVRREMIAGMEIPVPPIEEQRRIAQALSDIDDLIASLDALIAKKRDIKQGTMQQLLTGKRRLPSFSGEWQKLEFAKFLPLQRGFDLPSNLLRPGPFPVVYSNGVANWHSKGPCDGPGIVTGRSGTIGNVTYVDGAYWPHNTSLWVTSFSKCHPRFGFHFLVYSDLGRFSSGSGVPTLNRNDFSGWWINVPADLNEQKAIADCLDALIAEIDTLEEKAAKMEAIREGMMQQLLTGRIRLA